MKVEITKAQLQAIIDLRDDIQAMLGTADDDDNGVNADVVWTKKIKLVDRFLAKNNFKSNYQ